MKQEEIQRRRYYLLSFLSSLSLVRYCAKCLCGNATYKKIMKWQSKRFVMADVLDRPTLRVLRSSKKDIEIFCYLDLSFNHAFVQL